MMRVEADNKFCANCVVHNWKQPEDSSLRPCPGCGVILYCGEACRREHWRKLHKNHCQFLADPTKCPQSQHDAETCDICRPPDGNGKSKRRMAGREKKKSQASSNYDCFIKDIHFTPALASPHPFPVAGMRDDPLEKSIVVIQKLVHTLKQNPRVAMACSVELADMGQLLWNQRREIWRHRKVFSHPKIVYNTFVFVKTYDLVKSVTAKVSQGKAGKDASELWKNVQVVLAIVRLIAPYHQQDALKNPIDSMPEQFKDIVKLALDNKFEFLDIAEEIIDSLLTKIIPYEDIVKKLCGGKTRQRCSFCGVKVEVTEYFEISQYDMKSSSVLFNALCIRVFLCVSQDCEAKATSWNDDIAKLSVAVSAAFVERCLYRCDFCFQHCPIDKAHRCCNCLTGIYCSKSCHKEDKEKHSKKYCIEDERKTKEDRPMRRQMGEEALGKMAAIPDGFFIPECRVVILNETLEVFQYEDSKRKKQAGNNPDTKCEHDTSNTASATAEDEDDRSKPGTGAAPNTEQTNDSSASKARAASNTENTNVSSESGAGAAGGTNNSQVD